jgi:hypothetical protein
VGAIPHGRDRQPFDEGLGVVANALLDSDEQVILLFETIFGVIGEVVWVDLRL